MNGIKLGEDMVEGKVVINGSARTILEIKTKDGVVWPTIPVEYYVDLETYSWNPTSATQSNTISVQSNCIWSAVASHSWLTVTKISNTSVRFSVDVNESLSQRVGTVQFQYDGVTLATFTVTQQAMEATYTLDNLVLHYTRGSYLEPDQSNYAYLTADYNTYAGSTLVDSVNVVCHPEYTISLNQPIVTDGNYIFWDKDQYGKTEKYADYINVHGAYGGIETEEYIRVDTGRNTSETTYSYTKTFTIPSLTGTIPWEGGTYQFSASSFSQATETWTSGESESYTPIAHQCQLSASGDVTFSTYSVSGNTTGYVTFPDNPSSSGTYDREIIMTSVDSGSESFWFEQAAKESDEYVFEFTDHSVSKIFNVSAIDDNYDVYVISTKNGEYTDATWYLTDPNIVGVTILEEDGLLLANVEFFPNETSSQRDLDLILIQDGSQNVVNITIRQAVA